MAIHVRMKEADGTLRIGEDASVSGEYARDLKAAGKAWIVGGDAADFEEFGLEADSDVPAAVPYAAPDTAVTVTKD